MTKVGRGLGLALLLSLASCGGRAVSDFPVKIGRPYSVRGVTYTPAPAPGYDALGFAGWYGGESGNRTANGEAFRAKAISGAHTTLPLPSYVEVTSLETGRTILVRVNDRGPFVAGRIVDLSRGAADLLGIRAVGQAAVRVRRVDPPERDRVALRRGRPAAPRPDASAADLAAMRYRWQTSPR
ncbi:septal ring lytic transglycosylase RlpA family protein [Sphingomonas sp. RP10(2022)]|uniref:Endolytic peptidoglycan transglycosylase RlpA n=1 Tax=Sphingomonas liriopis TaxID=2949094 RepID=A0A9X2KQS5_9SPHN|nr:septal ring lytic transglycosylase RlpA family protein [Sphingomonas liriopis]MCP3736044.1 septal ring lytic transglycosylase RlpA family protein [Sphingomonas liriopis]